MLMIQLRVCVYVFVWTSGCLLVISCRPWFLHVSFPGPHDPFLVTESMHNAASDGRDWPNATDDPTHNTAGGACSKLAAPTGMCTIERR